MNHAWRNKKAFLTLYSTESSWVTEEDIVNRTCGRVEIMGSIVSDSAPYLYPFIVEYSLIGASVLYIMWKHIGRNPRYVKFLFYKWLYDYLKVFFFPLCFEKLLSTLVYISKGKCKVLFILNLNILSEIYSKTFIKFQSFFLYPVKSYIPVCIWWLFSTQINLLIKAIITVCLYTLKFISKWQVCLWSWSRWGRDVSGVTPLPLPCGLCWRQQGPVLWTPCAGGFTYLPHPLLCPSQPWWTQDAGHLPGWLFPLWHHVLQHHRYVYRLFQVNFLWDKFPEIIHVLSIVCWVFICKV